MATEDPGSWRLDPTKRHQYRWWDGDEWTDKVSDRGVRAIDPYRPRVEHHGHAAQATTLPSVAGGPNYGGAAALVGAAVACVGVFVPMVTVSLAGIGRTFTYFDTDRGRIAAAVAAFGFVLALLVLLHAQASILGRVVEAVAGAVVVGLAVYDRIDLDRVLDGLQAGDRTPARLVDVTVAGGLYVCIAGGSLMVLGALLAFDWGLARR
jgi:hypothetical protein